MKRTGCSVLIAAFLMVFNASFHAASAQAADSATGAATSMSPESKGQELFVGNIRFANHGPACNSCHNVNLNNFISGGALAKDLTQAVSRLTPEGVKGIVTGLPFPQMKQAYETRPLTEAEINDILAFLKHADALAATQAKNSVAPDMAWGGILGAIALLILFSFFWIRRKRRTVNQAIYNRQIKSF
ncbi:MAG: hypothetical protein IT242_11260 [Bacteroidia bacterium]|nr:hypothetical protein [Bacteroidia bacterium]